MKKYFPCSCIIAVLMFALSGCIWVDIPSSRECLYVVGDDFSQVSLTRYYRKYLYPLSPDGQFMAGSSRECHYYFSKNDVSGLESKSKGITTVKLYGSKTDARNGSNSAASMKIYGAWEEVVIEGGEKKFAGSYSKVIKAKFLPPEAWRLHESVKDMPVPEIIALLNSEDKIGDANVKDIVLTALGREGRINRGEAIELKEPLVMVGKDEWLYFVMTYDGSVIGAARSDG